MQIGAALSQVCSGPASQHLMSRFWPGHSLLRRKVKVELWTDGDQSLSLGRASRTGVEGFSQLILPLWLVVHAS